MAAFGGVVYAHGNDIYMWSIINLLETVYVSYSVSSEIRASAKEMLDFFMQHSDEYYYLPAKAIDVPGAAELLKLGRELSCNFCLEDTFAEIDWQLGQLLAEHKPS